MKEFEQVISTLQNYQYPIVKAGKSTSINEFFDDVIKPQFSNVEAIKQQHNALMNYLELDNPIFFIRAYGSDKDYSLLRRGFLSKYKNEVEYSFCDNTFAGLFASMKLAGIHLSAEMMHEYFKQRNVKCGFQQTSKERELAVFKEQGAFIPNLNQRGWYLAHIHSVGVCYKGVDFLKERDNLFPRGQRIEWDNSTRTRLLDRVPTSDEMKLLKAHFVRLTHPLNNFLVPKQSLLLYDRGSKIGEDTELISYVSNYIKETFSKEFTEISNIISVEDLPENTFNAISDISWNDVGNIKPKKSTDSVSYQSAKKEESASKKKKVIEDKSNDKVSTAELLNRMGAKAFIYYYLPLRSNPDIDKFALASNVPKVEDWTLYSKASRASVAKRIFKEDRVEEAFGLIIKMRLSNDLIQLAQRYYDDLTNNIESDDCDN